MPRSTTSARSAKTTAAAKKQTGKKATTRSTGNTAKKTAAKKTAAKKTAAKAPARKTTAKKTTAKKTTAAKKVAATKAPARKTGAKKTAARKTTSKRPAARKTTPARRRSGRAAPGDLAVLDGEKPWTKAELDEVIADLREHGDRLRQELHDQEEELAGLMRDSGDGAGHDQADLGATSFERDHELSVVNNSRDMLAQTQHALERIEDGSYGICESCGNPIGKMRLMAFPRATLCMSCKQREERR